MKKPVSKLPEFGIINIDKPSGPTSFTVSDFVRKKLKLRKTSHFGTLDPKVTGVLPIALNRACKLTGYFIGHDKEYVGIMRLHEDIDLEKIKEMIKKKFTGKIKQTPPVRSRVKRQEREREIKRFELLEKNGKDVLFRTEVEGGTYIRKLIDDLGKELGVGAHMLELRRTRAGIFKEEDSVNLYDFDKMANGLKDVNENKRNNGKVKEVNSPLNKVGLTNNKSGWAEEEELRKILIPAEEAIKKVYPVVKIREDNLKQILTGKPIHKRDVVKDEGWKKDEIVCAFCEDKFVGMYKIIRSRDIFAKAEFVMQEIRG